MSCIIRMCEQWDKLPTEKKATIMMLAEKMSPGYCCKKEKIKVIVENDSVSLKDYIESTFPTITYDQAKEAFNEIYKDYATQNTYPE